MNCDAKKRKLVKTMLEKKKKNPEFSQIFLSKTKLHSTANSSPNKVFF